MKPTSEITLRLAAIFRRRPPDRAWAEKEVRAYKKLYKMKCFATLDDLELIERYYMMKWPPNRDKNCLRHDLYTLLNNWLGELDRAVEWNRAHPIKQPPRKIIPLPTPAKPSEPLTQADIDRDTKFREDFKRQTGRELALPPLTIPQTFDDVRKIMKGEAE